MLLPFFIFECPFDSLQTVPNEEANHSNDVLQDYTKALNENDVIPRHMNQKLPENKLVLQKRENVFTMVCSRVHADWSKRTQIVKRF